MRKFKTYFDENIEKIRKLLGGERMTLETFLKITRFQFDNENFRYYLVRPYDKNVNPEHIYEVSAEVILINEKGEFLYQHGEQIMHSEVTSIDDLAHRFLSRGKVFYEQKDSYPQQMRTFDRGNMDKPGARRGGKYGI